MKNYSQQTLRDVLDYVGFNYNVSHITNNDFQPWGFQGYIAQTKNVDVDWAKATKSTTQEKLRSEDKSKG